MNTMAPIYGHIEDFQGGYYGVVNEVTGEWNHLTPAQNKVMANVGDRVKLEYRSNSSYGLWYITEIMTEVRKCPKCGHDLVKMEDNFRTAWFCPPNMPYQGCGYRERVS